MTKALIQPYLFFSGHCEEAIEFYRQGLGATVDMLMRYRDSPDPVPEDRLAPGFENKVMHATVRIGDAVLMMSDGCDASTKFEGFRLSLALASEDAAHMAFAALAAGGSVQMPLAKTFWSPCFGMVTDRFGVAWMVTLQMPPA